MVHRSRRAFPYARWATACLCGPIIAAALFCGGLIACTPQQQATRQQANLSSGLAQLTLKDLDTAIQIANAATPPDTMAITCATFLKGNLPGLQAGGPGFIPPTGVASTFETARIGLRMATAGMSSASHDALLVACAPLAVSVGNDVAAGALQVTNLGGFGKFVLSLLPAIGMLPL